MKKVNFELAEDNLEYLDTISERLGCSRSEALVHIFKYTQRASVFIEKFKKKYKLDPMVQDVDLN